MTSRALTVQFVGSGDAFGDGGRFQSCVLVDAGSYRLLLDCGATSLTAMKRQAVEPGSIDAVVISHYHADHYGGLPLMRLDGQFSHRDRPLTIVGPSDVRRRALAAMETAFPGSSSVKQRFRLTFHPLRIGDDLDIEGITVHAYRAIHTPGSEAVMPRVTVGGRTIAYTGDTQWTDALPDLAAGADLLICECYSWQKRIPYHLDHGTLAAHRGDLNPKRVVLTHLGPDMLAHQPDTDDDVAHDGLRIVV
jgi:ribonuclease BN (tRNA processing enzyme)